MKRIVISAWYGIRIAAPIFLLGCIIAGLAGGEEKFASGYGMARASAAVFLTGIGFGIPSLVYETKLSMGLKVLIHMGIGCLVMAGASVLGGWLSMKMSLGAMVCKLAIQIAIAFIIWGLSCVRTRAVAKQMNEKIAQKNTSE